MPVFICRFKLKNKQIEPMAWQNQPKILSFGKRKDFLPGDSFPFSDEIAWQSYFSVRFRCF